MLKDFTHVLDSTEWSVYLPYVLVMTGRELFEAEADERSGGWMDERAQDENGTNYGITAQKRRGGGGGSRPPAWPLHCACACACRLCLSPVSVPWLSSRT